MEPMHRGALIKRVSKKLGLREKDVRDHVESIPDPTSQSLTWRSGDMIDLGQYELIHPALHYGPRGTLMGIPLMVTSPQTGRREWEPWVITSERELFSLTHEELNRRGYYCNDIVTPGRQRYSQQVITEYLEGSRMGDLAGTFSRIKAVFQTVLGLLRSNHLRLPHSMDDRHLLLPGVQLLPIPALHRNKGSGEVQGNEADEPVVLQWDHVGIYHGCFAIQDHH
jgi:hypothetical protein